MGEPWWAKLYPHADETDRDPVSSDEGFAPHDPLDGRLEGNWKTRYPPKVHRHIAWEAIYLAGQGLVFLVLAAFAWMFARGFAPEWLVSTGNRSFLQVLGMGALAFLGGALGGTLYALKWLYHSVAKAIWNLDRRLWRLFTPWISGLLGLIVVALIAGNVVTVFRAESMRQPSTVFGVAALVGLFSDITLGKLNEVAKALFGDASEDRSAEKHTLENRATDTDPNQERVS